MTEEYKNKIIDLDHSLMSYIDSHEKAYLLGWIAGVGIVMDGEILIEFNEKDIEIEIRRLIKNPNPNPAAHASPALR